MKASKMPPVIFHYWTRGVRRRLFKRIPVNTSKVAYSFKIQMPTYTENYLAEVSQITARLDVQAIERIVDLLVKLRTREGRLFVLGVGGGAGHASHAVNDFRKIAGIEAYAPTDNVSELTARVNDDGWETVFANWLKVSRLRRDDMVLVFSVGGGSLERNISPNLVHAVEYAREVGATVCGVG